MNRKQLIILWIAFILICLIVTFPPQYRLIPKDGQYLKITNINPELRHITPFIAWDKVIQRSIPILIVSGLLIYTLRNKKR